jgi:hypothetical protein
MGFQIQRHYPTTIQSTHSCQRLYTNETFAPVVKATSIRTLLALAAHEGLLMHQLDVETAFLNGKLDEEIYVEQPPGYVAPGFEDHVLKLDKALHGLEQASNVGLQPLKMHCFNSVILSRLLTTASSFMAPHPHPITSLSPFTLTTSLFSPNTTPLSTLLSIN